MKLVAPLPFRFIAAAAVLAFAACHKSPDSGAKESGAKDAPAQNAGTIESATALLKKFLAPGADVAALSKEMRPTSADYAKVFTADFGRKLEAMQKPMWDSAPGIGPNAGQTELMVAKAVTEDFRKGNEAAKEFPGGYAKIGDKLQPGVTLFRFKFVKPGATTGMAFDGLTFVNGHWRIFPKPWRAAE